ncbi:hypothetical protein [Litoribacillus peritrichatus]|uniref:Uncharacterized protein n=1 Tax=Litoribacillus peritrichatus TaxID=718191 RepID=A0ABP7M5S3_9GAMM
MSNLSIEVEGKKYEIKATEKSNSWGNGLKLAIYSSNKELINSISYMCHPEFENYEVFQQKSFSELQAIAMSKLATDMATNKYKQACSNGLELVLPINKN